MKKSYLFPALFLALILSGCSSKDHDLTPLHGTWESTEYIFHISPEDPAIRRAIENEFTELYDSFRLEFYSGGEVYRNEFREYRYHGKSQASMFTGEFFYNHGYKARVGIYDPVWGNSPLNLSVEGDRLICRGDATDRYRDPVILESAGIKGKDPIKRVEIEIRYRLISNGLY